MAQSVQSGLQQATHVAQQLQLQQAPNGIHFAPYGETSVPAAELLRMVQGVPVSIAAALARKNYYFVPLAMMASSPASKPDAPSASRPEPGSSSSDPAMIAATYTAELAENAICHRNVPLGEREGVFISTRLLSDRFALAFEFFINVGHAFVDAVGVPASFTDMVWAQAVADVRGETSQDAWEARHTALPTRTGDAIARIGGIVGVGGIRGIDEKAKTEFIESAFSDAVAIYLLSLAVDFDYSELREREYPLLAAQALADRLRHVAKLFPPNPGYDFAIRYRRRA